MKETCPIPVSPSFDLNDTMGLLIPDSGELLRILCNSSFQNDTEFYREMRTNTLIHSKLFK